MSQLQETNQSLNFFCDFEKIEKNVNNIKLSLCMLNSLIGATDLRAAVETIWNRGQEFRCSNNASSTKGSNPILLFNFSRPTLL